VAGWKLGNDPVLREGLRMLEWLVAGETRGGHLSVVPAGGWGPGAAPWLRSAAGRGCRAGGRVHARCGGGRHRVPCPGQDTFDWVLPDKSRTVSRLFVPGQET
jgi:hypothetical protein